MVALDSQYQDAAKLLAFAESELKKIEERKKQEIRLAELYARAVKANKANNWTLVISTCQEIRTINPSYKDVATLLDAAKTNLLQQEEEQPGVKWEEKGPSYNKLLAVASVLGILLLGYWMIAPGLNDSSKTPDKKTITNSIGMEFMLIPAGEFDMGSPSNEVGRYNDEGPVHHVTISKAFYLGKYEVTQKQWRDVMGTSPSSFKGDDLPVEQVSWNEVQQFIQKLNEKESANKYRLPSEAEWEYAARGGTKTRYYFGDDESKLGDYAWFYDNSGSKTHDVGQKNPNPWGLYDMHGNVWEWVQDIYQSSYNSAPTDGSAWEGGGSVRVVRGGSWFSYAGGCRSAFRSLYDPGPRSLDLGFRLLRIS